jgi:basic amino acid/polyamine antiporter, APA family
VPPPYTIDCVVQESYVSELDTYPSPTIRSYLTDFFRIPSSLEVVVLLGIFWPLLVLFIQFRRADTSLLNRGSTLLKVAALVFFCAAGGWYLLVRGDFANYVPLFPAGVAGVISGASINFFAFASFSTDTLFSKRARRQRGNILLVLLVSILTSTVLYMSVAWVAVGLVNWSELSSSPAPLTTAIDVATDNTVILAFIAVAALIAISSAILASLSGGSQVFMAMARKEIFPDAVTRISRVQAPVSPVLVSGLIVSLIIVATQGDIALIATLFNFGTLMTYLFINASVIHLRSESPDAGRAFRVPYYPYLPLAGAASCLILPFFLNRNAIITGSAWIVLGVATYYFYRKRAKRRVQPNSPGNI